MIGVWDVQAMFNGDDDQEEPPLGARMASSSLNDQKSEDTPESLNQKGLKYLEEKNYLMARTCFKKAAIGGLFESKLNLGGMYMFGEGVPQNITKAWKCFRQAISDEASLQFHIGLLFCRYGNYQEGLHFFEKAQEGGHPEAKGGIAKAQCDIGIQCYNAQSYSNGLEWFEKAKRNGHPEGQNYIAKAQINIGIECVEAQNYLKALEWFEKARENRNPLAEEAIANTQVSIGIEYIKAEKFSEALKVLTESALHGNAEAQYRVGLQYCGGIGVPKNDSEGMNWLMLATQQEHVEAEDLLSEIYYKTLKDPNDIKAEEWFVQAVTQGYGKVKQVMIEAQYRVGAKYYKKKMFPEAIKFFMNAAENGHASSSYNVGVMHYRGVGVLQSDTEAMKWLEEAKKNGHSGVQTGKVQTSFGGEYFQKGNSLKALEWFELGAQEGNIDALYNIGVVHLEGAGVSRDETRALEYFGRALENAPSQDKESSLQYLIGLGYCHNKNFFKALEWFHKAVIRENKDALFGIATLYQRGEGVSQDLIEALKWYKLAKKNGHPEAQDTIAETQFINGLKFSAASNFVEAMKWYNKASKKNHGRAQHNIAVFHLNGEGVPKDPFEAIKWFKIARENGATGTRKEIATAQANIANDFYENKNFIEAVKWSKKSAKKGHSQAQFNIGVAYITGKGVPKNPYKALKWFEMAKENGDPEAQNALAETQWDIAIEYRDKGNFSEALLWFEKAKENGSLEAYKEIETIQQKMSPV